MAKSSGPTKLDKKSKSATTTTSKSSKDDSKSKSKPKKVSLKVVGANRFPLSEEIVEDSDSGDEMNVDEPFFKQRSKKQPVFEDKSQKEESQEEDDDMEQDTESEEEEPAKSGEEDFVTKENEESAEEDEESAVEEESGGEQDCVEERTTLNLKMLPAVFSIPQIEFDSLEDTRPVLPFEPPHKFGYISTKKISIGKRFDVKYLIGKKLLYLSAPARIPVKKLRKMSWERIQQGTEIFEHKQESFSLTMDEATSRRGLRVLLPIKIGYKPVHAKINHILQILETPKLKSLKREPPESISDEDEQPPKIPKREQPKNIRLRFRPLGSVDKDLGNMGPYDDTIDMDMKDAPAATTLKKKDKRSKEERCKEKETKKAFVMANPVSTADTTLPTAKKKNVKSKKKVK